MSSFLRVSVRFLDPSPIFHGQRDGSEPEWPPSPLRLFQALVDAAVSRSHDAHDAENSKSALKWLQISRPAEIVAPRHHVGVPFRIAVPNNDLDVWAVPISRGAVPKKAPNELKTMKTVHPIRICRGRDMQEDAIHYLYPLENGLCPHAEALSKVARSITHLGWGIDMAVGDASILSADQVAELKGVRWQQSPVGGTPLRVPKSGTLDDLIRKHTDFLNRVTKDGLRPVPPLRTFDVVRYRSQHEPLQRAFRAFELRNLDGSRFRYPHRKLIHIAGMVRHLAIESMKNDPPRGVEPGWVESYVAGHANASSGAHRQLSYLPLPSVGHAHADPGVRRAMIAAPIGDDARLDHLARRLAGQVLRPDPTFPDPFIGQAPPILIPLPQRTGDGVVSAYTREATTWHSVTPVILPGHDDHKPEKTQSLIQKALRQAGIDQPCTFEWSAFSRFAKSYSAQKYGKDKQPQGYIRPSYLLSQTAVHLTLRFHDGSAERNPIRVPGPIAIGAGRHCGLGLFAATQ